VAVLFFHRLCLFYPALTSFYRAVFNGLRDINRNKVELADFFSSFTLPHMARLAPVGCFLFVFSFLATLHWTLLPLYIYYAISCCFVLPLHVEHPHLTTFKLFVHSALVGNAHMVQMCIFLVLCVVLQLLGLMFFVVGILVAFPLAQVAVGMAYHHLVGVNGVKREVLLPMNIA